VMESILETQSETIQSFLKGLTGTVHVTFEEGTHAAWLYEVIKPLVSEVIVCNPRANKLLASGNKSDRVDVIFEKRAPGLRGWLWTPDHVLGDGRLRELDSEFEDFSMNPRSSPKRTLLMLRITSRTSLGIEGLPARPCRLFQVQKNRKPLRCQATTVSGFTRTRAERQSGQTCDSHVQKSRSEGRSLGRLGTERLRTLTW
jgi:hypothetical protein